MYKCVCVCTHPRTHTGQDGADSENSELRSDESDSDSHSGSDEGLREFPYPLGTHIARDFGDAGMFWGTIVKLYPDDHNLCHVRFSDGDSEDLDAEEVEYAVALYHQEFEDE